jgi:hypothetical protein
VEATFATGGITAVQVTGRRSRIDVSTSNNGATFTAKELARLPIQPSVSSIIQLAPNTTRADSRYAAGASFGGGGASENAYYINGFPVTNPLTQLGASELPFGAIAQAQVLTGGFGAEFGRSVGGVVNITTKSGTNTWETGATASIEPKNWRASYRDLYYGNTGAARNAATDGTLYRRFSNRERTEKIYGAYVGGPIIEDKLFMFISAEQRKYEDDFVLGIRTASNLGTLGWEEDRDKTTRYLAKFDWNITDSHRIEATFIGDEAKTDRRLYAYDYATNTRGKLTGSQSYKNNEDFTPTVGGDVKVLRYVGNIGENLTVSALYGESKTPNYAKYNAVGDAPGDLFQVSAASNARYPGLNYASPQVLSGLVSAGDSESRIRSKRLDLEYKLGDHTLRFGVDNNTLTSANAGDVYGGGGLWTYNRTGNPNALLNFGGTRVSTASGGGLGTEGYYVTKTLFDSRTSASSKQDAQYLEDRWQVTKDVLVTAGIRKEGFQNLNGDGKVFLEPKDIISPRLNASWDVKGDASLKVFGSAGRYALQIPTHLAVRGASRSTFTRQQFTYTGTDQFGLPTGLNPISGVYSTNNELGQEKDINSVAARGMKPTYQDEITLGFEQVITPALTVGAKGTFRDLKATIDDQCDARPFIAWAEERGIDSSGLHYGCASFNPGRDNTFLIDFVGDGKKYETVNLTAAELGFEKAKRTYAAVDLFAEHPLSNGWYGRINYTWSRSRGNTEGQTRSDNAQTDVAATSTWDTPELMVDSYGLLPNHRKHQIKAFGYYEVTPEWMVGGNFLAASGRPRSCFGQAPDIDGDYDYGSVYFYCDGKATPRGTSGKLPWDIRLDANVMYRPAFIKGLTVKLDVFNVFNKQVGQTISETQNVDYTTDVLPTYGRVISYTEPRAIRLGVEYNHRF